MLSRAYRKRGHVTDYQPYVRAKTKAGYTMYCSQIDITVLLYRPL